MARAGLAARNDKKQKGLPTMERRDRAPCLTLSAVDWLLINCFSNQTTDREDKSANIIECGPDIGLPSLVERTICNFVLFLRGYNWHSPQHRMELILTLYLFQGIFFIQFVKNCFCFWPVVINRTCVLWSKWLYKLDCKMGSVPACHESSRHISSEQVSVWSKTLENSVGMK